MFGREVELHDENIKLMGTIRALEEDLAEIREELRVAFIEKEDALADLEDVEDMIKGVEGLYDYWVRKTKRST